MELIQDHLSDKIIDVARQLAQTKKIEKITVRDILKTMNLSNRVFYNRFHNIDEVLTILYQETIQKVRESVFVDYDSNLDFKSNILNIATNTLILTYESRFNMSQFIFETDSGKNDNFSWWNTEIKKLIEKGKSMNLLKNDLDDEAISYAIWCFIRGFNTDALTRKLPLEKAKQLFQIGFGTFYEGLLER